MRRQPCHPPKIGGPRRHPETGGSRQSLLHEPPALIRHVTQVLHRQSRPGRFFPRGLSKAEATSAVLVPLSPGSPAAGHLREPSLVLNKRSARVRQPGDLCFPGGRVAPRLDGLIASVLSRPGLPLARWPFWPEWRGRAPADARRLALLLAAALRESFEEMRLNPFGVRFLGPLPAQPLQMFRRIIYPVVAWIPRQKRFFPNWEVARVVYLPLADLLEPANYGCYRLRYPDCAGDGPTTGPLQDHGCFLHRRNGATEILWGATYRIVMVFLRLVFQFEPPAMGRRPVVTGVLTENYLLGST